jgi:hypothetical protein
MLRESFIHVGGSLAINENNYYPPNSYFIGFTGPNVASAHNHNHKHSHKHSHDEGQVAVSNENMKDYPPFYHAPCMPGPGVDEPYQSPLQFLKRDAQMHEVKEAHEVSGPNDNDPPTGELCGSVFWSFLNQRFHYLDPLNETYVAEIERSIINVGIAALGLPGSGGQGKFYSSFSPIITIYSNVNILTVLLCFFSLSLSLLPPSLIRPQWHRHSLFC